MSSQPDPTAGGPAVPGKAPSWSASQVPGERDGKSQAAFQSQWSQDSELRRSPGRIPRRNLIEDPVKWTSVHRGEEGSPGTPGSGL